MASVKDRISEIDSFYNLEDEVLRDSFRAIFESLNALQTRLDFLDNRIQRIEDINGEE